MSYISVDEKWASSALTKRPSESNKGSFGRVLAHVGSTDYIGAMYLSVEAMLRGGAGYIELSAEREIGFMALNKFPEILYRPLPKNDQLTDDDIAQLISYQKRSSSTLIGCGCGVSENLKKLTLALIRAEGGTLIIDADAINSLALDRRAAFDALACAERDIILTPHPLEFSRLFGVSVDAIASDRVGVAEEFARRTASVVLLKGYGTVITDGNRTYKNTSGSSALAKAGSGDCLAGLIASLSASSSGCAVDIAALGAYIHGAAGDDLSASYSEYGVTPSDLPRAMAKVMRRLELLRDGGSF